MIAEDEAKSEQDWSEFWTLILYLGAIIVLFCTCVCYGNANLNDGNSAQRRPQGGGRDGSRQQFRGTHANALRGLTWRDLEAYSGRPATGESLEVVAISDQSLTRQVFMCQDRAGQARRIAAYTNSRRIPGLSVGKVLRWRNPRFHYFMDGSSGARIEESDLSGCRTNMTKLTVGTKQ